MIHLPALLGAGVTPRAGRFGLGRRCLRVLDARILPCIRSGFCRIGSAQRRILFGHCAKVQGEPPGPELNGCLQTSWWQLVNVKKFLGMEKAESPLRTAPHGVGCLGTRHFRGETSVEELRFLFWQLDLY